MDMYKFYKVCIIVLLCLLEQNFVMSRGVKKPRDRPRRKNKPMVGVHKEFYDSILATCNNAQNYMCKFDLKVKELQLPSCIPLSLLCDGIPQCPMHDDENGCPEKCSDFQMRCSDGACATACNNKPECRNLEDELFCAPVCQDGFLRCPDGNCGSVCDGIKDCKSGADERNCDSGPLCKPGEVYCFDKRTCAVVCDGVRQCHDGADEQNCMPQCPEKNQIICSSGKCGYTCDGISDCSPVFGVSPDEKNCPLSR